MDTTWIPLGVSRTFLLRLLVIGGLSPAFMAGSPAVAQQFAAGIGAVEQGDDRFRPAANIHVGFMESWYSQLHLWGRDFGPVKERSYLLGVYRRIGLHALEELQAIAGIAALLEETSLEYNNSEDEDRSDSRTNFGAAFGLLYDLPFDGPLYVNFAWQSHIFPAGFLGGLFLASGRKQTLSLTVGYQM